MNISNCYFYIEKTFEFSDFNAICQSGNSVEFFSFGRLCELTGVVVRLDRVCLGGILVSQSSDWLYGDISVFVST